MLNQTTTRTIAMVQVTVAGEIVHNDECIIIRLNEFASVLDAELTAIRLAQEDAIETRDNITIHTRYLTAVNILNNRKLDYYEGHQRHGIHMNT